MVIESWRWSLLSAGDRTNVATTDLSEILPEEVEAEVKLAAEISMGTEVSEQDIANIRHLCDQVCSPWWNTCWCLCWALRCRIFVVVY